MEEVVEEVKATALAVIQKTMMQIIMPSPEVTAVRAEVEPQPTIIVKTPFAASTEEKDLDITTAFPNM